MSQMVCCEVCGKIYNQSHVRSHQRLAHGIGKVFSPAAAAEPQKLQAVLALYQQLSDEGKKQVLAQLGTAG
jgi:DUF917 family protein